MQDNCPRVALNSSSVLVLRAAIGMFTLTKWEVEKRVKSELPFEQQKNWYAGTWEPLEGFIAAESFQGAKPGHVFKMGRAGLGYYPDKPPTDVESS